MSVTIHKLPTPKEINHDQFVAQLGFPVCLHLDADGLAVAVQVEDPYYLGRPAIAHAIPGGIDEAAILAAVAALG